jgi:hypothetical protein
MRAVAERFGSASSQKIFAALDPLPNETVDSWNWQLVGHGRLSDRHNRGLSINKSPAIKTETLRETMLSCEFAF